MYKKFMAYFFMCFVVFLFSGCGKTNLQNVAKDITNYEINLEFDKDTKLLTATQTVDYINTSDVVLNYVDFHLYPNSFDAGVKNSPVSLADKTKAYPNGVDYGRIDVSKVMVENQEKSVNMCGEDKTILQVDLNKDLYPNDRIEIYMEYKVLLPNVIHRFGYGDNTYNFGNFYPIACVYENGEFMTKPYNSNGDPFYSEMANYEVSIKTPSTMVLATTGDKVSSETLDNKTNTKIKADVVRDFAFILSEEFKVESEKVGNTEVNYYYFSDENPTQSLKTSVDALKTFSRLFGDYPYNQLSVAEANFLHGGMEYPNLVFISNLVEVYQEYGTVIVHEIAHQWWYNLVGNNEFVSSWLDEGLTEYSTLMFYEENPEYGVNTSENKANSLSSYLLFVDVYSSVYGEVDTTMNRSLDEYRSEVEYVYITYVKGMLLFDNIDEILGREKFLKCLKTYFNENCFKVATEEKLISAFEETSGVELESFFDSWISGKVVLKNY